MYYIQFCNMQSPCHSDYWFFKEVSRDAFRYMFLGFLALFLSFLPLTKTAALTIERVSTDSNGSQTEGGNNPVGVSSDGRFVAFNSGARDLAPGGTLNLFFEVFLKDTATGATTRISTDRLGNQSNDFSLGTAMTPDGRYVVFQSSATNLVPGGTNGAQHIFLKDTMSGETTLVSADGNGVESNDRNGEADISDDGRYIVFRSLADNLVATNDTKKNFNIYFKDMLTGAISRITNDINGVEIVNNSDSPAISGDGRFVVLVSSHKLAAADTNQLSDVFVKDMSSGTITLVSTDSEGNQASSGFYIGSAINLDGRYVTFDAVNSNLLPGGGAHILLKDTLTGITTRVSTNSSGGAGGVGRVFIHSMSADGRYVVFDSAAISLVPDHLGGFEDIFIKDTVTNATALVSTDSAGNQGLRRSERPVISADGQYVAFQSFADNLVPDDTNDRSDVFLVKNPLFVATNDVDSDNDGVIDIEDNCTLIPNGPAVPDAGGNSQLDTDADGFGNSCDPDLDNDGLVNSLDLGLFKAVLLSSDPDADFNGDGIVNSLDLGIFKKLFLMPPGPSGLVP